MAERINDSSIAESVEKQCCTTAPSFSSREVNLITLASAHIPENEGLSLSPDWMLETDQAINLERLSLVFRSINRARTHMLDRVEESLTRFADNPGPEDMIYIQMQMNHLGDLSDLASNLGYFQIKRLRESF